MDIFSIVIIALVLVVIILQIAFRPKTDTASLDLTLKMDKVASMLMRMEQNLREDFKLNREELYKVSKDNREELAQVLAGLKGELSQSLHSISVQNQTAVDILNKTLDDKTTALIKKIDDNNVNFREMLSSSLRDFVLEQRMKMEELKTDQKDMAHKMTMLLERLIARVDEKLSMIIENEKKDNILIREAMDAAFKSFKDSYDKNVESFNQLQKEKFAEMEGKQLKLIENTERKLEVIRETVDEKLQKTLNERLGQSFELVGRQLESVQKGLGEMQTLAQDVGGLKRVLSNVKMRGGIGEVQLEMLLEQILAPDQYAANVKTKPSSANHVEFAIKLPGRDDQRSTIWLPIDAKFPKDVYEQLQTAYDTGDMLHIELAQRMLDKAIRNMAKDIHEKYIEPPYTTDFAIMFLPFEGIYGEVVRKSKLLEDLQRMYRVVVTGPTTLAAILNSLQMGFKTLAIQQRSGEVWKILGAVKTEFDSFGGLLQRAQNNIQMGLTQLDDVVGKRTRAIQSKLKNVESLSTIETIRMFENGADEEDSNIP